MERRAPRPSQLGSQARAGRAGTPGAPPVISVTFVGLPTLLKWRSESITGAFEGVRYTYVQLPLARICPAVDDYPRGRSRLQRQRPFRYAVPNPAVDATL